MQRRGFTLIELLSVIIILSVIATIVYVLVGRFIENSKQTVFIANTNEIIKKLDLDRSENGITISNAYTITDNKVTENVTNRVIVLKNITGITGNVYYDVNGNYTLLVRNNKYCTRKNDTDKQIMLYPIGNSNCTLG